MIQIHINKACAHLCSPPELLTAGMAKAVSVEFAFSSDWDGLTKTAVFTNGRATIDVLPAKWDGDTVTVPPEILAVAGRYARVGVYGTNASGVVLPTVWVSLGKVQPAAEPSGDPSTDPTLPVWAQLQEIIGDLADLTTKAKNNLVAAINEAAKTGSGGAGSIDLRTADGYIQYSNDGGATWENLIALAELKGGKGDTGATGPQGAPGKDGSPGKDGADGAPGQDGFSPSASVAQTGTGATITITDKTGTTTAEIKNGKDGAPGKAGTNGKDGADGADGTTFTPSVSAAGDLSWTNDGGKANPAPVNIKGPQGAPGKDYTLTDADKTEIAAEAAAAIAGTSVPSPASAAVGQIVRVKAVDAAGKITETEAVDLPTGGGEGWEKIADVAFTADTSVYEIANFGVYRKVKVLMHRAAYVSGLNKNVWFRINSPLSATPVASMYMAIKYGYLMWEVNAEVDAFIYVSRQVANNPVAPEEIIKTVAILPPTEPGNLKFNIEFVDTSVIQDGDTVAVYGVKR
nr:MAG TPA: collagen triple helix repeat protein [Caudoviricetes sp.]